VIGRRVGTTTLAASKRFMPERDRSKGVGS
jgi:hypothetical protein